MRGDRLQLGPLELVAMKTRALLQNLSTSSLLNTLYAAVADLLPACNILAEFALHAIEVQLEMLVIAPDTTF